MKQTFLTAAGITLALTVVLIYLLSMIVARSFKKSHGLGNELNLSQGVLFAGRLAGCILLITGIFAPLRDFLLVSSAGKGLDWSELAMFLLIGCCCLGVACVLAAGLEKMIAGIVYKGKSIIVELKEDNLAVAIVCGVLNVVIAIAMLFSLTIVLQGFIPTPAIPSIH
jgi:hypothetical protein